ncbi:MAG: molybdenum cofactor guanylyltransferase [Myxococcota bacterium]|nr:molybdenum cofactor guanylyltransferase [Myxococcota bacterium]
MQTSARGIASAVLAGGGSLRFGEDKAFARAQDSTFLEHVCAVLTSACNPPIVVGRPPIPDLRSGVGPLGGLETALTLLPEDADYLLLAAVDMPGLSASLVRCLVAAADADVVVPFYNDRLHPLCARWHKRALPVVSRTLDQGKHSVHAVLDQLEVMRITEDEFLRSGVHDVGRALANINIPSDLHSFVSERRS